MENYLNNVYLTDKITKKTALIADYPVTLINAPTGYGKSTVIKEYAAKSSAIFLWINVANSSKELFWADFCDKISDIDKDAGEKLMVAGRPQNESGIFKIRSLIKNMSVNEPTYLVIDNYQRVEDENFNILIHILSDVACANMHFVFITQKYDEGSLDSDALLHIGMEDLKYSAEDIVSLFSAHNLSVSPEDAAKLYDYSEGWIAAICLQMVSFADKGNFDELDRIEELAEKTVCSKLNNAEKTALLTLSVPDYFTLKEAVDVFDNGMGTDEMEAFLGGLFFVRFERNERRYYIHNIILEYLRNEFHRLSEEESRDILVKIAAIYIHRGDYISSYKVFYETGEWEAIYSTRPAFSNIYPHLSAENKNFFIALAANCPKEVREKYPYFSIIMCLVLFVYNEKQRLTNNIMNIVYSIEDNDTLSDDEKNRLFEMVYFVRGYTSFNDIAVMNKFFDKALEYGDSSVIDLTRDVSYTFGCPSVFHIFHREDEDAMDETVLIDKMLLQYYKLSEGHGKGSGALFKAELLYNTGDFVGAETLCHKALYMADSRGQKCIALGALLLLARLSVHEGDYDALMENVEVFRKKAGEPRFADMIDLCEGYIYSLIGNNDRIAPWLTDYNSIENRLNLVTISYANIIYGKYLFAKEQYQKLLGISSQFLGVASLYQSAMAQIYTYIYIAMCNYALGNKEKAVRMNTEAIRIAFKDNIIMPFVENLDYYEEVFEEINYMYDFRSFIKKIKSVHKKYSQGSRALKKNAHNKENFGLTQRELEVAMLAAKRLSNKEIAEQLFIAESTVKSNMKIVFSKLGINSRTELSNFFK